MGGESALGDLIDVRQARLVVLHDAWVGYNPHSPIAAVYELRRGARGGLAGEGRLSTAIAGEHVVDVRIPATAATRFLDDLAAARMVPGECEPMQDHTDDYPRIEIALHVGVCDIRARGGIALLFTESQGKYHSPWGACVTGKMWTLAGDEVGRALAALAGPLKRATLDRMMR